MLQHNSLYTWYRVVKKQRGILFIIIITFYVNEILTYLLNFLPIPQSRVSAKLNFSQLAKKFPALYGTRMFITAMTKIRRLTVSWARYIQPRHLTSWISILILSIHLGLGLPSGPLSLRSPHQNFVRNSSVSFACHRSCPSHSSRTAHPQNISR